MDIITYALLKKQLGSKADLIDGKIPAEELPSYVDDVIEYESLDNFPEEGEASKIYVALDTGFTYRWSGSTYIQIGGQDLSDYYTKEETDAKLETKQNKLPDTTSADEGKVLMVDSNGDLIFEELQAGLDASQFFTVFQPGTMYYAGSLVTYNNQFYTRVAGYAYTESTWVPEKWVVVEPHIQYVYINNTTLTARQAAIIASDLCAGIVDCRTNQQECYRFYNEIQYHASNWQRRFGYINSGFSTVIKTKTLYVALSDSGNTPTLHFGSQEGNIYDVRDSLAPAYSASATYSIGDLVIQYGKLYQCTTEIPTAEAWNSAHWTATSLADAVLGLINTAL